MNKLLSLGTAVFCSTGLIAQTSSPVKITTATPGGYGVWASSDNTTKSAGIADKTTVSGRGAYASARTKYAYASTSLRPVVSRSMGAGASFRDSASAFKDRAGNGGGDAGTAAGDDKTFKKGAHSAMVNFAAASGKEVELVIYFSGSAHGNAQGSTSIDVDGDGKADFTAKTDNTTRGTHKKASIKVKAGAMGIDVKVTNEGSASLAKTSKDSRASYSISVSIYARTPRPTYSCTVTPFGAECAGKLAGSSSTSSTHRVIKLNLTKSFPNAIGLMVIGQKKISTALPGGSCKLLVDPVGMSMFRTDSNGERTQYVRAPLNATGAMLVQDVVLKLDAKGATFGSSNGLEITCKKN